MSDKIQTIENLSIGFKSQNGREVSILKDISDPEMSNVEVFFPVFVIYPILLIVFAKKYNWTNWKEKLFGTVTNN